MMHALTNGGWGFLIRRFLEAGALMLPLMALLFLPLFAGLGYLYPWTDPNVVAHNEALQKKHLYLNVPALAVRMAVAFGFWSVVAWLMNRWSFAQDRTPDVSYDPADARPRRAGTGRVRAHHVDGHHRLDHGAGKGLVFDRVPAAGHHRADPFGVRFLRGVAVAVAAVLALARAGAHGAFPFAGQFPARLHDDVGLPRRFAAHHHLVGQPAARDRVVCAPRRWRLETGGDLPGGVPFRGAVFRAARDARTRKTSASCAL